MQIFSRHWRGHSWKHVIISLFITGWRGDRIWGALTCFPHEGGRRTVDYILGPMEAMKSFTVPTYPIGTDHTYLLLSI